MNAWALERLGSRYIVVMMVLTRFVGLLGGSLTIYYVNLTLRLPDPVRHRFDMLAIFVVGVAVTLTIVLALWETRCLRPVLRDMHRGLPVDGNRAAGACRQAIEFCARHHTHEAFLVPLCTTVPVCAVLRVADGVGLDVLGHIVIATFLGISTSLLATFFVVERWMQPVICYLLEHGARVPYDDLPEGRLHARLNIAFSIIVVCTGLLIGALANQRAVDIVRNPQQQAAAVADLSRHIFYIMLFAIVVGMLFSRLLSSSITFRVRLMVEAMKRVQQGQLSERLKPTGNDEIDTLARQFNAMVEQLYRHNGTIRDLNANLEDKVRRRTRQLAKSRRSLKRSLLKLHEYDRLKTEFFSNISHELRSPLTMILTPVDRLIEKQGSELPATVLSMLQMVRGNGHKLSEMIDRLLDFSKLEAGQMKLRLTPMDLNLLAHEIVTAATPLAGERGISIDCDCDGGLPIFSADAEKLDIAISNLISNALKFTPPGGSVRIETLHADDRAWVVVSDTGIGIAETDHHRIFDRFVQIDGSSSRQFSGTGLGLALTKQLVELHGGEIYVASRPGHGSRFWFDVPLLPVPEAEASSINGGMHRHPGQRFADLATHQVEPCGIAKATHARSSGTVLVVDDTPEMRILLGDILSDDYEVLFAGNGVQGLEAAISELPDLIISDVMMPLVDGYEFCRRSKADPRTAAIPFVLLTAKAERSMKIEGLDGGADDYLTKPFDERELKARARSLIRLRRLHQDLDKRNRDLHTAFKDLEVMQGQLVQAEKMSSLGQLVAGLAHEINNSINAVYNGINPLALDIRRLEQAISPVLTSSEKQVGSVDREEIEGLFGEIFALARVVQNGAQRTARIIADLKTFSHPGNEDCCEFDLHEALDMCLNLLFNQIKHRITLRRDYGDISPVFGPSGQLNQVFMNILNNAQQAIPGAGEIVITTRQVEEMVAVSIRDTGAGMTEDVMRRIFDPFFTTKEPGVGTGLGLSLSYGIITRIGGSIDCLSASGKGSEFIVKFPRTAGITKATTTNEFEANELAFPLQCLPQDPFCVP